MNRPEPFEKPIWVTRPYLPPLEEFHQALGEIWDNRWLTNNGPVLRRYVLALQRFFETENVCLFANGTLALQIGLQGMGISGEVITTPFTFVATTHALFWNRVRPVFVDIEPDYYTLDPEKIEAAITPWTSAILAVHVYGHACNLDALAQVAHRHNLKLIYDAAHAFGVRVNGRPIGLYGDLSMFSFHATKPYHSIEGGALVFQEAGLRQTFDYLKNFGFKNELEVVMPGTNAKMNEFQALMGSLVLHHMDETTQRRRQISIHYRQRLRDVPGIHLVPEFHSGIQYNYAYVPIEVDQRGFGVSRDVLYERLKAYNVHTRRYFYPLICDFACYRGISIKDSLAVARRVGERILTLPIYDALQIAEVDAICDMIAYVHGEQL